MRYLALAGMAALFGMVPTFGQAPREMAFDGSHAEVRPIDGRWLLMADGRTIKDLGPNENDAQEALQLIRNLNLNQYGVIGTPRPVLEYWLSDGQVPRGLSSRLQRLPFDAGSLRVEAWRGQWCLRDARQVLFVFGPHEADARQALAVLQHHGFNQVAYVGRSAPVMMCFLNDPTSASSSETPPPIPSGLAKLWGGTKKPVVPVMPPGMLTVRQLGGTNPLQMAACPIGDWLPIDWRRVDVRNDGPDWKLFAGEQCLADFGPREQEARTALEAVRYYRFTEQVRLRQGTPSFALYLSGGQAPRGLLLGLNTVSFRPDQLELRQTRGRWMICDLEQPLIDGGDTPEQAKQVLQTIQRLHFDTLCRVGEDGRGMSFLVRNW